MREIDLVTLSFITRKLVALDSSKVTLCIIAKNEQANLAECITSAGEFVDEIVVVDRGSTDNTVDVARELGAKVFFLPLNSDFARVRNFALDLVLNNWILILEPEERLVLGIVNKAQLLQRDTDIWLCPVDTGAMECGQLNFQPRLFKRSTIHGFIGNGCEDLQYTPEAKVHVCDQIYIKRVENLTSPVSNPSELNDTDGACLSTISGSVHIANASVNTP